MPMIQIAHRNRAPSKDDARHDEYAFDLDIDDALQPLFFTQSIGGGFAERGGSFRLGVHELTVVEGWRESLEMAGCGWVIGVLEPLMRPTASSEETHKLNALAVQHILEARAEKQIALRRSGIEPDAERAPFYEGPHIEHADFSLRCDDCPGWVSIPAERILDESAAWLRSLSGYEYGRVLSAFACRTERSPSGREVVISHDSGAPAFGLVSCAKCAQRYAVYFTCDERQPARYWLRLQGFSRVVPSNDDKALVPVVASVAMPAASSQVEAGRVATEHAEIGHAVIEHAATQAPIPPQAIEKASGRSSTGWFAAPGEPPQYYESASNKPGAIAKDIAVIYAAMHERREQDNAAQGNALYFHSDGTQSKLHMYWMDRSKGEVAGEYAYTLVLRDGEFADADVFEKTCRRAVGLFVRKHLTEDARVYFRLEFDSFGRRVHKVPPESRRRRAKP
jgi:hypothetical protein